MKSLRNILIAALVSFPALAFAQTTNFGSILTIVAQNMNKVLLLMIGLAVLLVIFYVVKFFTLKSRGEETIKEGGTYVLYAVIGLVVIVSFWGIVNILLATFGTGQNSPANGFSGIFPSGNYVQGENASDINFNGDTDVNGD